MEIRYRLPESLMHFLSLSWVAKEFGIFSRFGIINGRKNIEIEQCVTKFCVFNRSGFDYSFNLIRIDR